MFKNLFFQAKALPELSSQLDAEIPRYPPFLKGLPAASPEDLQSTQDELIAKLRQVLGFNLRDFQRLIQPCIDHLAAYVHLLPASEHHHHSGAGGLLRHSLEVAFWAAQAAESIALGIRSIGCFVQSNIQNMYWSSNFGHIPFIIFILKRSYR